MNGRRQVLLSLPPRSAVSFERLEQRARPAWVAVSDPADTKLGSGGGTAHLLEACWRATSEGGFTEWLGASRKLIVHAGGESRRAPAYAAAGKILTPMPVWRWSLGQRLDQSLLDLQVPFLDSVLSCAPARTRVLLSSGDVLLRAGGPLPDLPEADVICLGLWVPPDEAQHFGVFFCPRSRPERLQFVLQKPRPERIQELAPDYLFLVDTGVWLLSDRALSVLMAACGWDAERDAFAGGQAGAYDLYTTFGEALGAVPTRRDSQVNELTAAVVPLPRGEFYHFGTTRDLVASSLRLQNVVLDQRRFGNSGAKPHPAIFTQNSLIGCPLLSENHSLWIENSCVPESWSLASEHVITNVPPNRWRLCLASGQCLDIVPTAGDSVCVRVYGMDDRFRGAVGDPATLWHGQPAVDWFSARGLTLGECGIDVQTDIQNAAIFPVVSPEALDERFVQWLLGPSGGALAVDRSCAERASGREPLNRPLAGPASGGADAHAVRDVRDWASVYRDLPRMSASEIARQADLDRLYAQRRRFRAEIWPRLTANATRSVFFRLDLAHAAAEFAEHGLSLPPPREDRDLDVLRQVRDQMFRAEVYRRKEHADWSCYAERAFEILRSAMIERVQRTPVCPELTLMKDQILWGRSPVRLDLAGGWTDTPPYCLQHGGRVVNLAADLNGQPPIQVFIRATERRGIVLRSIDLGAEERLASFEELASYSEVGGVFSIPKAALALAGFLPAFSQHADADLGATLSRFGGGLELSLLAAVPKGSGLGTSSILAATVLGTLSAACGLHWTNEDLIGRTLVLEQMLTTGGGWQDQAGGILPSVKCVETLEGLDQAPIVHWLPERLFDEHANHSMLLYYTGITRVAKGILQEIVRGMFLNSGEHVRILSELGRHAEHTCDVIQRNDWAGLARAVRTSWGLNCALDPGTNPPQVEELFGRIRDFSAGAKLLGAGGGGYVLILAKSPDAAARIRNELTSRPPNEKARFVDFSISKAGFQATHS
jgi:galactokinase/mevalonate kinase-like predicted kinase